ncbi:DinI family protein [Xenorhabdus nematophila]|uniref:DinI-like family protein n=1 Tax=Xenorhabdus nematophila TaxID=628 RepID=UPI000542B4E0|nr:DinI-like family protein [Xenorhabdus nematophila]CEF30734.1 DinI-like protein in retron EC67 [Xenorhabdus nematophila str. Websteri]AYA40794.1 DinI family protein [Xenorhabdus nematophila]MBA0019542.1 DinI family protein [Xenorhabdus nematophila]MCB4423898.1 DinI-like family protein [Xenorhabdus nematophila]QNJ35215.1 DinI family protein [Xenorhabdus nematophila]
MRVEILFDKRANVSEVTMSLLESELKKRILPQYPDMHFRVAISSSTSVRVTGTKNSSEHDHIMELIQSVWEDDSWLSD